MSILEEKQLSVAAIKDGTVIDHLTTRSATRLAEVMRLHRYKKTVTLGLNLPSRSMGMKDLIKIEGFELSQREADQIALFSPQATIIIIRDFKVVKKQKVKMPTEVKNILHCANPKCITNFEPVRTHFYVERFGQSVELTCRFCEKRCLHDTV